MGGAPAAGSGPGSPAASCTGEGPTSPTCLLPVLMRAQPHATKHRNPASTCLPSLPTGLLRGLLPWFCLGLALALPGLQPCSVAHTLSAAHTICGSGPQGFPLSTEFLPEGKVLASCVRQTVPALPSPPPPRLPCPALPAGGLGGRGEPGFPQALLSASPVPAPGPLHAGTGARSQAAGEGQSSEATDLLGSEVGGPFPSDFGASLHT